MIIGIDPGNSGAISLLSTTDELIAVHDMPTKTAGKKKKIDGFALSSILTQQQIDCVYMQPNRPGHNQRFYIW